MRCTEWRAGVCSTSQCSCHEEPVGSMAGYIWLISSAVYFFMDGGDAAVGGICPSGQEPL